MHTVYFPGFVVNREETSPHPVNMSAEERPRREGLAFLAYYNRRPHPREALLELLWPECDPAAGRHRLQALTLLRRQSEPPGIPAGAVILAGHAAD
jgi:DNA-binding SARP family transcriptional activator